MRPGSGLRVAEDERWWWCVVVVDSIDGLQEAYGCVMCYVLITGKIH